MAASQLESAKEAKRKVTCARGFESKRRRHEAQQLPRKSLNVLALNVDGLRELRRAIALAAYAKRIHADVVVITEIYLRSREPRALVVDRYAVVAEHSRETDLAKMCVGVVSMARAGVTRVELKGAPRLSLP